MPTCGVPTTIYTREHRRLVGILREIREESGWTQAQLAQRLRRPQSFVSRYENGQRRLDLIELRQVCRALDVSLLELVREFDQHG